MYLGVARYWDDPAAQRQLDMLSENHHLLIQSGLLDFEEAIDTVSDRVRLAGGKIDRNAFVPFADRLRHKFVDFGSIGWIPRIGREARAVHEASAVGQGLSHYRITERGTDGHLAVAADRAEYFPLFYVSGEPADVPIAGLDLRTDPVVRAAIDEAWGGEWRIASGLFRFETGSGPKSALALLEPVYLSSLPRRTAKADRALYRAKHQGRDQYCFYSPQLDRVEQSEEIGNRT
jgi:adenylate cyclase